MHKRHLLPRSLLAIIWGTSFAGLIYGTPAGQAVTILLSLAFVIFASAAGYHLDIVMVWLGGLPILAVTFSLALVFLGRHQRFSLY